jgi:hypothetical protein
MDMSGEHERSRPKATATKCTLTALGACVVANCWFALFPPSAELDRVLPAANPLEGILFAIGAICWARATDKRRAGDRSFQCLELQVLGALVVSFIMLYVLGEWVLRQDHSSEGAAIAAVRPPSGSSRIDEGVSPAPGVPLHFTPGY